VSKRVDTGRVEFRIEALSRRADPGNLLVAAGFILFGRRKQAEFALSACERMAQLTRGRLEGNGLTLGRAVEDRIALAPDLSEETGAQRVARRLRGGD
jgi:hypothetical protein